MLGQTTRKNCSNGSKSGAKVPKVALHLSELSAIHGLIYVLDGSSLSLAASGIKTMNSVSRLSNSILEHGIRRHGIFISKLISHLLTTARDPVFESFG